MDHCHVFLHHRPFLDGFGKGSGRLLGAGVNHDAAYVFIQPVDGKNLTSQLFFQCRRDLRLGVQSHALDTYDDLFVGIENVHRGPPII